MHTEEQESATVALPIAERWRRLKAAYRVCNLATHHVLGFTLKLLLVVYFAFAIVFLLLRYVVLPNIDMYKGDIETIASRALGNPVQITRIYASWRGLRPNLFLGDVILRDREGRQVLSLPSVSATLSWWSVAAFEPRFYSLDLGRPDLDVRRAADGKLYVAGILLESRDSKAGGGDWVFRQREVRIREGRVVWTDDMRKAPPLALHDVNLLLRNKWQHHRVGLQATPPASLSGPIDVRADFVHPRFSGSMADVRQWTGELYADVRDTDLAAWNAWVDYPFPVTRGYGSVRAWLNLDRARLAAFTADVGLVDVNARLGKDLPALALARVQGRMSAAEAVQRGARQGEPAFGANGHTISLSEFSLVTADGLRLAPTTIAESYTPARAGAPEKIEISARQLDLEAMARLAAQLPLDAAQRSALAEAAPRGRLSDFYAQWTGTYPALASYKVKGRVDGLTINARPARVAQPKTATSPARAAVPPIPGVHNLSGTVEASEQGGSAAIDARDMVLQLPAWFEDPAMPFDQLALKARWRFEGTDQLALDLDQFDFVQGALKGSLSGRHTLPLVAGKKSADTDLTGTLSGFDIATIGRYLPLQTPPDLRGWLTGALEAGTANDVSVRLRGDLGGFPFRQDRPAERNKGEFRIAGKIADGRLNYAPAHHAPDGKAPLWPQADKIMGSFVFERTRMEIRGDTAQTLGVALSGVKAVVADLTDPDKVLEIDGSASGPLQEMLQYVSASPVLDWIGRFTEPTRATGNAKLGLKLHLPLARLIESRVEGSLQLMNNDVVLFEDLPPLQAAIGKIEFNEHGVTMNGLGASFLGGPLAVMGGSQRDNSIVIKLVGTLTSEGLRRQYSAPGMQHVMGRINGSARYTGAVVVKDKQVQVTVDSPLNGLGLDFPVPANKAAADTLPLHFVHTSLPGVDAALARDEIKIALGSNIAARYLRQKNGNGPWRVLSGGVGVNVPAPEPDSGMMVNVNLKTLNVDQWTSIGGAVAGAQAAAPQAAGGPDLSQYIVPQIMAARAEELIIGERKLDNVVVGVSQQNIQQNNIWQASIDSRQVSGHVTWNEGAGGQGLGKVTARLASLIIPESAAAEVKDLLESGKSPASSIPALDIVAERFELFNKQLGRLELQANNIQAASGREWHINRLYLANDDGTLRSTGKWVTRGGQSSTSLNFKLDIADAGKLLDRFGFPETLRRGKGSLEGDIAWQGLPYSLDIPSLSGQLDLNVASGQFLKQDPGAAKLLGVLSLQMLPRLLKLDFHDVFSEGLAFDGISARAIITRGVARTDNLKMHGVAATILMDGTADIANESTNLHVVVIPEFNLGTGPLVYALAVNPVVGLGSFLAQLFLRAPVMKALTYEMQVTGPWKAPIITKLASNRGPKPGAEPAAKQE